MDQQKKRESNRKWREANLEKARECTRESMRKWREANLEKARERSKEWIRKWRKTNPEMDRERNRELQRKKSAELSNSYILHELLIARSTLRASDIPAELIEAKRVHIKTLRLLKEQK